MMKQMAFSKNQKLKNDPLKPPKNKNQPPRRRLKMNKSQKTNLKGMMKKKLWHFQKNLKTQN